MPGNAAICRRALVPSEPAGRRLSDPTGIAAPCAGGNAVASPRSAESPATLGHRARICFCVGIFSSSAFCASSRRDLAEPVRLVVVERPRHREESRRPVAARISAAVEVGRIADVVAEFVADLAGPHILLTQRRGRRLVEVPAVRAGSATRIRPVSPWPWDCPSRTRPAGVATTTASSRWPAAASRRPSPQPDRPAPAPTSALPRPRPIITSRPRRAAASACPSSPCP